MTDAAPPQPPDMGRLPMSERTSAMEKWLVDNRIAYEEGTAGIKKAWTRAQNRHRDAARREREREAHRASGVATPLPSSIARMARAPAQTSTCDPSSRRRDAAFGRELIGLLVDVPWSAWDGYPVDSGFETGIVWEYHAQPPGRFVISFDPGGDHDDKNDDIGMGWGELMGEQHCLSSEDRWNGEGDQHKEEGFQSLAFFRRCMYKNRVYRRFQQAHSAITDSAATWDVFDAKGGPWARLVQKRYNAHRQQLLPCELAAQGTARPRFLDRMPCRVRADGTRLEGALAVFRSYRATSVAGQKSRDDADDGMGALPEAARPARSRQRACLQWDASAEQPIEPTEAQLARYHELAREGNATCFSRDEAAHPINFYEQADVCPHCGAERFRTTLSSLCCQGGKLCFNDQPCNSMPARLLGLISSPPGLSKQSRAGNELFRFAQFALPKGTHRFPDSYKHLKVTGIPYAIVPNVNEASSTRSFFDDPYDRFETRDSTYTQAVRPSDHAMEVIDAVLRSENPLVRQLINWSEAASVCARLVLKWPGTTTAVRAFTVDPAASVKQPRTIFFTRRDEDEPCYVKSSSPEYAPLMWPLAFPRGEPMCLPRGVRVDAAGCNMQKATLAMLMQPERHEDGTYVTVRTPSPYGPSFEPVWRRFSRFELMGRLGDEFVLDRWLGVLDDRLRFLSSKWAQNRMVGRFDQQRDEEGDGANGAADDCADPVEAAATGAADAPETEGDLEDMQRGTYLPPSVVGAPRYMREKCADSLCTVRHLGRKYLLFLTFTVDKKDWPELNSRLVQGAPNEKPQDAYDRASLHSEVFKGKAEAFLARLRSGTIFRNLGRPTVTIEEYTDDDGRRQSKRVYKYPMQTGGGGYLIVATEDQDRGLAHIHVAYSPAEEPKTTAPWKSTLRSGERLDHIDELVCARIPDDRMLRKFKMVLSAGEARTLLGVSKEDGSGVNAKYAYLDGKADEEDVLHPDIVADFGYKTSDQLRNRLVHLVSGTPARGVDGCDHWSLHPYTRPVGGKLVHKHHGGPNCPDAHCKRNGRSDCKDHYPKEVAAFTHMTKDGYINYERGPADIMIVPYNPWILLYFTSHINVEFVCSPTNVILYLFKLMKYIHKGEDKNRCQLVADGEQQRGEQGSADGSTHRRDERPDEIKEWRNCKTTCAPYAYRRLAEHTCYVLQPPCEAVSVHPPRRRDPNDKHDTSLSDWEKYLARPSEALPDDLAELNQLKLEDFLRGWRFGSGRRDDDEDDHRHGAAPAEDTARSCTAEELACGVRWWSKDGRPIYLMDEATAHTLRANTEHALDAIYYWRRKPGDADERTVRLKRVPRSCGVNFYVRLLAKHVAARSFEQLRQFDGVTHETFEVACRARGLLAEDTEAHDVIDEALTSGDAGVVLRSLFAHYLHEGYGVSELLDSDDIREALASDVHGATPAERSHAALADLNDRLQLFNRCLSDYAPHLWAPATDAQHEVERERRLYADRDAQRALADSPDFALDTKPGAAEQSEVVRWGMRGALCDGEEPARPEDLPNLQPRAADGVEVGVVQGDGGAGKTRSVKRLATEMRQRGKIVLVAASTNLAATNYENGMSTHALCLLAGEGSDDDGNVTIQLRPGGRMTYERLALLRAADLIVIDEYSSQHRAIVEALLQFLRAKGCNVRVVLVGDAQQIPPVIVNGSREEVIEASVLSLPEYKTMYKMPLTKAYRQRSAPWAAFARSVGNNSAPALLDHPLTSEADDRRALALDQVESVFHKSDAGSRRRAVEWLYGVDEDGHLDVHSGFKAILCARNDDKDVWNEYVNTLRAKQTGDAGRVYTASHTSEVTDGGDAGVEMAAEALGDDEMAMFQNADHSVPLAELTVREGDVMLLAKTIDKAAGLVKNQRVIVEETRWNAVVVRIASNRHYHRLYRFVLL